VLSEVRDERTRRLRNILVELIDLLEDKKILSKREVYRFHRSLGRPKVRVKKPKE
jgi:hypothetical protein